MPVEKLVFLFPYVNSRLVLSKCMLRAIERIAENTVLTPVYVPGATRLFNRCVVFTFILYIADAAGTPASRYVQFHVVVVGE